jgi:hypothetical protein
MHEDRSTQILSIVNVLESILALIQLFISEKFEELGISFQLHGHGTYLRIN